MPQNFSPMVNSKGNEWAPLTDPKGIYLYFAIDRYGGCGKQEFFKIKTDRIKNSRPENPGSIMNPADDDFDAALLPEGILVFTSTRGDHKTAQHYYFKEKRTLSPVKLPGWTDQ